MCRGDQASRTGTVEAKGIPSVSMVWFGDLTLDHLVLRHATKIMREKMTATCPSVNVKLCIHMCVEP